MRSRPLPPLVFSILSVLQFGFLFQISSDAQQARNQGKGQTVTVQMTNQSSTALQVLRGGRPGKGNNAAGSGKFPNKTGSLGPNETLSVSSVKGRVWSFMLKGKLVAVHTTTGRQTQGIVISQAQVNAASGAPGAGKGNRPNPGGNPKRPGKANPGKGGVAGNTGSKISASDAQALVNYHNQKRREVGTPNVKWSSKIARYAQTRADTIARAKQMEHLPAGQNPYGENLGQGGSTGGQSGFTAVNAAQSWYSEKAQMPRNARVFTSDLFNLGVGHYTQMVWKGSTEIGAGIATYQKNGFTMTVVVCCYNPKGNYLNQPIF